MTFAEPCEGLNLEEAAESNSAVPSGNVDDPLPDQLPADWMLYDDPRNEAGEESGPAFGFTLFDVEDPVPAYGDPETEQQLENLERDHIGDQETYEYGKGFYTQAHNTDSDTDSDDEGFDLGPEVEGYGGSELMRVDSNGW
jgi:hypothetical protein